MNDKRLFHTVADKIMEMINSGAFPPGSRLPGERELAEQFEVSRVTIREAEIALQALGHINIKTGSGVYVLDPTDTNGSGWPNLSAFELTEARLLFESEAAALAARHIDDGDLQQLEDLIARMSSADPADEEDSRRADQEFHLAIGAASKNAAVRYIVETLWKMRTEIASVRLVHAAICSEEDATDRGSEHAEVLEALRNRDPDAARNAMRKHFKRLLASMIDITEEQELRELQQKTSESRQRFLTAAGTD
ncbi:MAG: FadR family transcriptional regulator [Gammaproteobacteria bacterium]|nr:FadR family transcriptional regulator [Gammaproteobacteria bacterium]NNL50266.1 FadR family transcriptional regulator [Woeseiaceae bacterium]